MTIFLGTLLPIRNGVWGKRALSRRLKPPILSVVTAMTLHLLTVRTIGNGTLAGGIRESKR